MNSGGYSWKLFTQEQHITEQEPIDHFRNFLTEFISSGTIRKTYLQSGEKVMLLLMILILSDANMFFSEVTQN